VISAAPQIIYLPQAAYIPQPLYVGQPLGVTRFIAQPVQQRHHRHTDRQPNSNPHPNGRPSPAAQMQRGNDPSPAARMQGHSRPPHVPPVVRVPEANRQPIVGQPDIRPRYPERRPRG
jgi:hypothetical protein